MRNTLKVTKVTGKIVLVMTADRIIAKLPDWIVKLADKYLPEPKNDAEGSA